MKCWPCTYPNNYDYFSMAMFKSWSELCEKHLKIADGMVPKKQPETTYKPFVPPTPIRSKPHWTDREPGEDG